MSGEAQIPHDWIAQALGQVSLPGQRNEFAASLSQPKSNVLRLRRGIDPAKLPQRFVFVVNSQENKHKATRRTVEIGEVWRGGVEVVSGIEAGELLITAGIYSLKDGEAVVVRQDDLQTASGQEGSK